MSNIIIEDKNINDIDQSNFQTVGPYTNDNEVYEPWQGRNIVNDEDQDGRFKLGTYTENNREFWEFQTTNRNTRKSQFVNKTIRTARAIVSDNNLVISDETDWSVDTFVYTKTDDEKTIPLFFYYDKKIHREEYNVAVNGNVNMRIELREDGRDGSGVMDNFLVREPFRPFVLGTNTNVYDGEIAPGGETIGDGAFNYNDLVTVEATPYKIAHFVRWSDGTTGDELSVENPYTFNMPRKDIETVANFNSNPIINISAKVNGVVGGLNQDAGRYWLGLTQQRMFTIIEQEISLGLGTTTVPVITPNPSGVPPSEEFNSYFYYNPGNDFYLDDELKKYRPGQTINVLQKPTGDEYLFEGFTYIHQNGNELDMTNIPASEVSASVTVGTKGIPNAMELESQPFPNNVFQIYANYTILLFYIRSFNNWILSRPQGQGEPHRLIWGYGGTTLPNGSPTVLGETLDYTDWTPKTVESTFSIRLDVDGFGGYENGDYFWYQLPSGSADPTSDITGVTNEFDSNILFSLNPNDDENYDDGVRLTIQRDNLQASDVGVGISGLPNIYTYIGRYFNQLGTYVKISKTDDSHDFSIANPNNTNVIRNKENSSVLDADMYQLGANLQWSFTPNLNHELGEVGEMPTIQSIRGWNNIDRAFETTDSSALSALGMAYNQDGNSMRLTYNTPNSVDSNIYIKYFEFIMKSTIVPPPLEPFLGVFEINFNSNSENLGTVSFLQQADEIPQTTIIGQFGDDNLIETPTHAINMDAWHDGATVGIIPIPLDIDINAADTELGTLTTNLAPNFESRVDQILDNSNFDNYDAGFKMAIKNALNNYLNIQITDNNSFSIEPSTTNEAVREVLTFVEQNNDVPRLPLRITGFFVQMFTLTINSSDVPNNGVLYPTKFITNWDQDAYDANSTLNAADTWLNDELLETTFANMSEESLQISIPPAFFNGSRELKIIQQIPPQSEADQGTELFFSGTSDPTVYTNEISTFRYRHRIVDMDSSAVINLNWIGGF